MTTQKHTDLLPAFDWKYDQNELAFHIYCNKHGLDPSHAMVLREFGSTTTQAVFILWQETRDEINSLKNAARKADCHEELLEEARDTLIECRSYLTRPIEHHEARVHSLQSAINTAVQNINRRLKARATNHQSEV